MSKAEQTTPPALDAEASRYFAGQGEMPRLMREHDWASSALGPVSGWPQSLKTAISICLGSKYPIGIYWGPRFLRFYNDAYTPILGPHRHPQYLGLPMQECWPDAWKAIGHVLQGVLDTGECAYFDDLDLVLTRRGHPEEAHFTVGYGPLRDETGAVGGIFYACEEITHRVLSNRRLAMLNRVGGATSSLPETLANWVQAIGTNPQDIPFAMLYSLEVGESGVGGKATLLASTGEYAQEFAPAELPLGPDAVWPLEALLASPGAVAVDSLAHFGAALPPGPWPEPPASAHIYLVGETAAGAPMAALVLGVSSRLAFDESYAEFFRTLSRQVGTALTATLERQEELQRSRELEELRREAVEAQERLSSVLESITDGFIALDREWRLIYVNREARETYGFAPPGSMAQTYWERYPAALGTRIEHEFRRAVNEQESVRFESYYEPWQKWFEIRAYPSPNSGLSVYFRDITEEKLAEAEHDLLVHRLEAERARLRNAFMASPAFMCILSGKDHEFEFLNEQYSKLIGGRDALHKTVKEALPEVVEQGFIKILDDVISTGQPFVGKSMPIHLMRSGESAELEQRYVDFVYQPIDQGDGTVSGIFVHGIDTTEQMEHQREREQLLNSERAARSEAERTSRMKDEFLATLSHELRTPLNAILGWSSILRGGQMEAEELAQGLDTIERNARAQTQIIEDLLDMSRIISGKVRLDVQRIDLASAVQEAVQTLRTAAEAKGIRLQSVLDPMAGPISGDHSRLQQVFWNLLNNAIKFTPRGGRVQVLLERVNSHVEVSVLDTGEGIKPEFLPIVFDRFRQADASTTRRHGGLGLGLAIVKQLVELHGGTVRAKSAGEGKGATFVVALPLTILHPDPQADGERRHPRSDGTYGLELRSTLSLAGVKVLVVDDEPDARGLVKRLLEDCHAAVHVAGSVQEALDAIRLQRPDVLVSDIGMPGEDGYTLIRKLRALEADAGLEAERLPAVALTAYARAEDRMKAIRAGFQMHIAKPVEPAELITIVASLAGRIGG